MQEDNYELDEVVLSTIENYFPKEKAESILNIIDTCYRISNIQDLNYNLNIVELESTLIDLINENDAISRDELADLLDRKLKIEFLNYFKLLGITLSEDILFRELLDLFNSVEAICNLDEDAVREVMDMLENDTDDNTELFCNLLEEYSNLSYVTMYELIEDVDEDLIINFKDRFNFKSFINNPNVNENIINIISKLKEVDANFMFTKFINSCIKDGLDFNKIRYNEDTLYNNLEKLNGNMNMIPYEIVSTLALSSDTKDTIYEYFKENIYLENIDWIGEDNSKHIVIDNLVKELSYKVKEMKI